MAVGCINGSSTDSHKGRKVLEEVHLVEWKESKDEKLREETSSSRIV